MIRDAKEYIRANFSQSDLSLNRIAAHIGVSPSYFSSLFSQEVGSTFVEYLTGVRMEKAKELLLNPDIPVGTVAVKVGYGNYSYFSKLFKDVIGCTPNEYRKNKRGSF